MAKKVINTPRDFDIVEGKYIIPGDVYVRIFKGEFLNQPGWEQFQNKNDEIDIYKYIIVNDDVVLDSTCVPTSVVRMNGGVFNGDFIIKGAYFNYQFEIAGGEFNNGISVLNNTTFDDKFSISGGVYNSEVSIKNSKFNLIFEIAGGEFLQGFYFENSSVNEDFTVDRGVFNTRFTIKNCPNINSFTIYNGSFPRFIVDGVMVKNEFGIYGGDFNSLVTFVNNKFLNRFDLINSSFKNIFQITSGSYSRINFLENADFEAIHIYGGIIQSIVINDIVAKKLLITKNRDNIYLFVGSLKFTDKIRYPLKISKIIINKIDFDLLTISKDVEFLIEELQVNYIRFNRVVNYTNIFFINVSVLAKEAIPDKFIDLDGRKQYYNSKNSILEITNSDLGNVRFIDCNLSSVSRFIYNSSRITDVFVGGTSFPKVIEANSFNNEIDNSQKRLGYSQLKKIFENRGDFVEARSYYSLEMRALREGILVNYINPSVLFSKNFWLLLPAKYNEIKFDKTKLWHDCVSIPERFLLWLNRWSNNFTTSWILGVVFTLIVTHVFFGVYAYSLGYHFQFDNEGYDNYYNIFKFFSITSNFDLLDGVPNFWTYLSSLVGRLFIAFGIYQTIAAFRKHGRSGA